MPTTGKAPPGGLPSDALEDDALRGGFELTFCDAPELAFCNAPENDVSLPPELADSAGFAVSFEFAEFAGMTGAAAGGVIAGGPDGDRTRGDVFIPGGTSKCHASRGSADAPQ